MDIIELQGKVSIPDELLAERRAELRAETVAQHRDESVSNDGEEAPPPSANGVERHYHHHQSPHDTDAIGDEENEDSTVVEVPLGHIEQDHINAKRCTLCIGTLRVDGGRGDFKHPLLVLRRRRRRSPPPLPLPPSSSTLSALSNGASSETKDDTPLTEATSARSGAPVEANVSTDTLTAMPSSQTVLFEEWLQQHPTATKLNELYALSTTACSVAKNETGEKTAQRNTFTASTTAGRKRARDGPDAAPAGGTKKSEEEEAHAVKDYDIIGVVEGYVRFNSKPARVFA